MYCLLENQNPCYLTKWTEKAPAATGQRGKASRAQPDTRVAAQKDFFIWIRRNPLKNPKSAKVIQGNPSFFPWIHLVFLGSIWW
jgi:hypothetical protein